MGETPVVTTERERPVPPESSGGPDGSDATRSRTADRRPVSHTVVLFGRELAIVVLVALILSLLIKTFLVQPFWIPSGSMSNTLVDGDRIVVSKLTPGPFDLHRGDVVVFTDPGGWLPEHHDRHGPAVKALQFIGLYPAGDNHLIKRVIGLPGDRVKCCTARGLVTVNGTALHEPYLHPGDPPSQKEFDITVPQGRVWVMGDHRSNSGDSRYHDDGTGTSGSVPIDDITGRAIAIVWPIDRVSWLSDYSQVFDRIPSHDRAADHDATKGSR